MAILAEARPLGRERIEERVGMDLCRHEVYGRALLRRYGLFA
jgi:hypothetical protein